MLKQLKSITPSEINVNSSKLRKIANRTEDKVSYVYKNKFSGIYTELKRAGKIKREDSWEKFVNPDKLGIDNYLQKALNTSNAATIKSKEDEESAPVPQSKGKGKKNQKADDLTDSSRNKETKPKFRNQLERFQY